MDADCLNTPRGPAPDPAPIPRGRGRPRKQAHPVKLPNPGPRSSVTDEEISGYSSRSLVSRLRSHPYLIRNVASHMSTFTAHAPDAKDAMNHANWNAL